MEGFLAIILICSRALAPEACDERAALEVRSVRVTNELGCSTGWQEIIARSPERSEVGLPENSVPAPQTRGGGPWLNALSPGSGVIDMLGGVTAPEPV
jgi:hypothetical protein